MTDRTDSSNGPGVAEDFYIIERKEKPYREKSQWKIGKIIRTITKSDWAVGYYNYPFRPARNEFDESPDIVLLHADIGLVVITCRGYEIDEIQEVTSEDWDISGNYDRPVPEVQEQLAHVQSQLTGVADLMNFTDHGELVAVIALPEISASEWNEAGYPDLPVTTIFSELCERGEFKEALLDEVGTVSIPDEIYKKARKRLNQGDILSADRDPIREEQLSDSKSHMYRAAARSFEIHEQDKKQEQIGLHIPPGPQQIRGIAGSGKTTIMAKKAAVMHLNNPDWDIAYTFRTRSLYQTIENNIKEFYRDFSNGEDPGDNLEILHGWGAKPSNVRDDEQAKGIYREIAQESDHEPYQLARRTPGFQGLNTHCAHLVTSNDDIEQIYDAILIDEAQDFGPAFYRMCYDALREPKRLIWAYDEAQTLNNLSAPSPKIIFYEDDADHRSVDLSGFYEGSVKKSFVMRQSYRTPRDILMAAHALGMGLYRENGIVRTLTNKEDWDAIGYTVDEECTFKRIGSEIRISRKRDLSPHPLQSRVEPGSLFSYSFHDSVDEEAEEIAQKVVADIEQDELDPNQIMVVCIGPKDTSDIPSNQIARNVRSELIAEKINDLAGEELGDNDISYLAKSGSRDKFRKEGKVTIAASDRAKGNEAPSVYIAGAELIPENTAKETVEDSDLVWRDEYVQIRNEVFVGLTRSEGWCHISGVGDTENSFFEEVIEVDGVVSNENPTFVFEAPDVEKMKERTLIDETVPTGEAQEELDGQD